MNSLNNDEIKDISDLNKLLLNETVLLNLGGSKCEPCKKIYPEYEKLSKKYTDIKFIKIELDKILESDKNTLKERFKITKYPHFSIVCDGIILETKQTNDINEIENWIKYL